MSSVAARVRAHRERRKLGQIVLTVAVDEANAVEVLTAAGLLAPLRDHSGSDIARAFERLLDLLSEGGTMKQRVSR